MNYTLYVYSKSDAVIRYKDESFELIGGSPAPKVFECDENELELFVYPFSSSQKKCIPYIAKIRKNEKGLYFVNNPARLIMIDRDCYELNLLDNAFSPLTGVQQFSTSQPCGGKNYKIIVQKQIFSTICIKNGEKTLVYDTKHNLNNISCSLFNSVLLLKADTEEKQYMFLQPLGTDDYEEIIADDISTNNGIISSATKQNDILKHIVVEKQKITALGLEKMESYFSFDEVRQQKLTNHILGICFFECIKCGDYVTPLSMIDTSLGQKIKKQHLKDYFPKFERAIKCPKTKDAYALIMGDKTYFYKLELNGDKIINIAKL